MLQAFTAASIKPPATVPRSTDVDSIPIFQLDNEVIRALSALVEQRNMTLAETIQLWRGQTPASPSPNKAIDYSHFDWLLHDYKHAAQLILTAKHGVQHRFQTEGAPRNTPVPNHTSATTMQNALVRSIRDGQNSGGYMVVTSATASRWSLQYSPFGCVEKSDADPAVEARVIHDLSCPTGSSTNSWSDQDDIPTLVFYHVDTIAHRIIDLRQLQPTATIKLMKGDVKTAYKNLHVHEDVSAYFAGSIPEQDVVVIDLALPFGWTGSGAHYGVFGKAITHLVTRESPHSLNPHDPDTTPFFCFDWVDDHVLAEHDVGDRLEACDSALRLAMTALLGPRAINKKKFTVWSTKLVALGLEWDTREMTVSMPEAKIQKALRRIRQLLSTDTTSRNELSKLLGSLRHVCSCIRPAKPFFQRLVALWKKSSRYLPIKISRDARLDLRWFKHILVHGRLRGVPLEYFRCLPDPAVHLYMDSSDNGLCVLNPARHEYIRIEFDRNEKELIRTPLFSINVREQFSALLAVLCWGSTWRIPGSNTLVHVRAWIDNSSAVSWCNKLSSANPFSQEMNRIFGVVEAEWGIRLSAGHLAGTSNYLADLGSRAWTNPLLDLWAQLTTNWTQVTVPESVRRAYDGAWSLFSRDPLPIHQNGNTTQHGETGSTSADESDVYNGFRSTIGSSNLSSWFSLPLTNGNPPYQQADQYPPFSPELATSSGIIRCTPGLNQSSTPVMPQHSPGCDEFPHHLDPDPQLHEQCSNGWQSTLTTRNPSTASFLGLRCWVSSIS